MPAAFRDLAAEDPPSRIEHGTGQVVLWTTGPAHLDLVLARLRGALQRLCREGGGARPDEGDPHRHGPRPGRHVSSPAGTASSRSST